MINIVKLIALRWMQIITLGATVYFSIATLTEWLFP